MNTLDDRDIGVDSSIKRAGFSYARNTNNSEVEEMAKTYAQFLSQIDALRAKADAVRRKEAAGQIKRVRDLISLYGLTADDLGLSSGSASGDSSKRSPASRGAGKSAPVKGTVPKFQDGAGHSWTGRGPRPGWLKAALAQGRSLDDFAVGASPSPTDSAAPAAAKKAAGRKTAARKGSAKPAPTVKFRLGDQAWSGRGPQPRWLKEAIEGGKSLVELRV